jgi:pimeloyl-ACP methyl ester carboxylesterase
MRLPERWQTDSVRANGIDLQYHRIGSGPPILLAHGFYDDGRRWVPLARDLADDYEVVAYDARGHGQSDAPETGYDLDSRIGDLCGVVEALGLEDPILLGHSMGAATAAWTAATRPALPRALVLEDPVGVHDQPEMSPDYRAAAVRDRLESAAGRTVEELIEEHYPDVEPDQARRLATASHECSPRVAEIAREAYPSPLAATFSDIESPTLVLRRDAGIDRRVSDLDAADSLRDGRLVHVPGAGHYVFQGEYDAAYAELRTFLRRV